MDLFLSTEEVAQVLKVSDQTVINLCNEGKLRYAKVGRQYRIFRDSVEEMIGRKLGAVEKPKE